MIYYRESNEVLLTSETPSDVGSVFLKRRVAGFGLLVVMVMFLLALQPLPVHSSPSLSLDGSGSNFCGAASCSVTPFSTSNPNDVIIVVANTITGPSVTFNTPTDSQGHLSFTLRRSTPLPISGTMSEWWAVASPTISADTIQVTTSSSAFIGLVVWGISGANIASPFDPSVGVPATNSGVATPCMVATCTTTASVTIPSTSNANDMILGMIGYSSGTLAAGSGFTLIANPSTAGAEYKIVSSTQSGLVVPLTITYSEDETTLWSMIGDAVQTASTPPPIPEYPLGLPFLVILMIVGYGIVKRRSLNRAF